MKLPVEPRNAPSVNLLHVTDQVGGAAPANEAAPFSDNDLLADLRLQVLSLQKTLEILTVITGALAIAICAVAGIRTVNAIIPENIELWLEAVLFLAFELGYGFFRQTKNCGVTLAILFI